MLECLLFSTKLDILFNTQTFIDFLNDIGIIEDVDKTDLKENINNLRNSVVHPRDYL
ncbi:MAG: hypothetical protein GF311_05830 [Candidatus Lokiarchaeota archaeon]|nr:hypothetical protein [Candidatus Lokiarchaeota archaeon]